MRLGIFNIVLLGVFSISHSFADIPEVKKTPTIEVRVLRVPAFQSIMKSTPQEGEGVSGVVMGGNVTAYFPEGLDILETSIDKDYSEIKQLIKDKISTYPCSCSEFIQINPYSEEDVDFNPITGLYDRFELHDTIFRRGFIQDEYSLYVSPIITNKHNLILILNFEVHKGQLTAEDLHEPQNSLEKELFNQALEMSVDKTLLVGFAPPKIEGSSRGAAYWLIFSLKNY